MSQGANGGISPFYFNTHEICISGGTTPYNYSWNTQGFVRQAIITNPAIGEDMIRINYSDRAIWSVTVMDANGCSSTDWEFTNDPSAVGGVGVLLDIYETSLLFLF